MSEECKKEPTEQVAAKWVVIALVAIAIGCLVYKVFDDTTIKFVPKNSSEWAAWVQAAGVIVTIAFTAWTYWDSIKKQEKNDLNNLKNYQREIFSHVYFLVDFFMEELDTASSSLNTQTAVNPSGKFDFRFDAVKVLLDSSRNLASSLYSKHDSPSSVFSLTRHFLVNIDQLDAQLKKLVDSDKTTKNALDRYRCFLGIIESIFNDLGCSDRSNYDEFIKLYSHKTFDSWFKEKKSAIDNIEFLLKDTDENLKNA